MRAAASRCVAWSQRSQILRIALLQDGFSLSQRARALRIFAEVYSAQLLRLGQPPPAPAAVTSEVRGEGHVYNYSALSVKVHTRTAVKAKV